MRFAIRESSMHQDHVLNMLCHDNSPFQLEIHSDRLTFDIDYGLTFAEVAASSMSLAASFGWDM
jgi:hypothetical protein